MNAPSSLAWMLSEILHGCRFFACMVMLASARSHLTQLFGHAAIFWFVLRLGTNRW